MSQKTPKKINIKKQFILWFLLIAVTPLFFVSLTTYVIAKNSLEKQAQESLQNIAKATEGTLFVSLQQKIERVVNNSFDSFIGKTIVSINKMEDKEERIKFSDKLSKYFANLKTTDPFIVEILILDQRGKIAASSNPQNVDRDLSNDPLYLNRAQTPNIIDAHKEGENFIFSIGYPIQNISGVIEGTFVIKYNTKLLSSIANGSLIERLGSAGTTESGKLGEAILVNKNKLLITKSRFEGTKIFRTKVDTDSVNQCLIDNTDFSGTEKDYRGVETVAASKCITIGNFQWTLIVKQDIKEIFAPVKTLLIRESAISIISIILIIFLAIVASNIISRQIGDPLKKVIEKERRLSESKSRFITVASHQFRTPLSSISWNMEMFLGGELGKLTEEQEGLARATYKSSQTVIRTLDDTLTALDIETKKLILEKEEVLLENIINTVMTDLEHDAQVKKIKINIHRPEPPLPPIKIDKKKIQRVAFGLIDNAVKYTKEGGEINIKYYAEKNNQIIKIKDNGIGIPKDEQSRIFGKFYRGSNALKMFANASGISLFIAKHIIESHDGKIWFESEEGKGTTFYISLPVK